MATVLLQNFADAREAGADTQILSSRNIQAIRTEAREAGIREGAAAAGEAFESEQSKSLARIQEAIGDTFFAREEAYRLALNSLKPLVLKIAETIAPALCQQGLSAEIADIVQDAARRAPDDRLTVFVSPDMATKTAPLFDANPNVDVREDSELTITDARVDWSGGYDRLDLAAVSDSVLSAIHTFFDNVDDPAKMRAQNER